jgi:hypothetical protein
MLGVEAFSIRQDLSSMFKEKLGNDQRTVLACKVKRDVVCIRHGV